MTCADRHEIDTGHVIQITSGFPLYIKWFPLSVQNLNWEHFIWGIWDGSRESKVHKESILVKTQTTGSVFWARRRPRNQMTLFDFPRESYAPLFCRFLRGNSWLLSVKIDKWLVWDRIWKDPDHPLTFLKNQSHRRVLTGWETAKSLEPTKCIYSLDLLWSKRGSHVIITNTTRNIRGLFNFYWSLFPISSNHR